MQNGFEVRTREALDREALATHWLRIGCEEEDQASIIEHHLGTGLFYSYVRRVLVESIDIVAMS